MHLLAATALLLAQAPVDNWKTYTFPGGFTVDHPGKLAPMARTNEMPPGSHYWQADSDQGFDMIYVLKLPEDAKGTASELLGGTIFGLMERGGATIVAERDILQRGWPGVEIEYTTPAGDVNRFHCFAVNGSVFYAGSTWLKEDGMPNHASRFLYSMCIPAKAGQGPLKKAGPAFETYQIPEGKISLRFPGKPKREEASTEDYGFPAKPTRYTAGYANRNYLCACIDMPEEAIAEFEGNEATILERLNGAVLDGASAIPKTAKSTTYILEGATVMSTTAKARFGSSIRVDTFVKNSRLYILTAFAPKPMMDSDEVSGFFKSIKFI